MTTVKTLLKTKFDEFIEKVKPIVTELENSFKVDEDLNYLDALDIILFLFPDEKTLYNLEQFLDLKQISITDENKTLMIPILDDYLIFLRKIKKLL